MKQALTVLDGLLIPLKRDLENQPVKLREFMRQS